MIQNNVGRKEKSLWTDKGAGSQVSFRQFDNAFEEAEFIAGDVARRVKREKVGYGKFAVLYRTNAQSRLLEERMIVEGIPYNVVGGVNFYSRKEIKDVLSYLKTVDNGRDDLAVRRIINVPKRSIGPATVEKAAAYAGMYGISLFEAMEQADKISGMGKAAGKLATFVDMIRELRDKAESSGIGELIEYILERTDYEEYLRNDDEESAGDRLANIDELITKAVAYEDTHDEPSLSEFLEEIALVADIDNVDGSDDRVLLMTFHSAKGLEFPFVYMAGMEDGLFPGYITIMSDDPSDLEEERRLAYVGITRAKEELTLTCAKTRMIRGETQYNPVSRFVREIPPQLLDSLASEESSLRQEIPEVFDFRPKAVLKPKATAKADKPYIARGIDSLNRLAGISKGASVQAPRELEYGVGDRVKHIKYGDGIVLKIDREPRDYKVTVNFEKAGQKIMYASFAKLKRL